ncbi:bifunctional hydroxymethylpyrimidine kinase/phosphomethylpyrimidine kinase [Sphingorhabdus sp. Alg239-R122]|uniref:bifunctional hydroxymethylpyrimidine kinase/phosphomethylpyrimidine kinase n=1 Tax=Sphingorhabdus sp. Alg239-R122 TaxID=2305989 RepID=UPI0019686FBA|nr:bifunctional hydroxymethylpyrimidine kinase/phosphomethylpyrimidine kinase [Sphingorhabdus sp. Alg239-R122]
MIKTPRILSIAGSDSGGGAGIQADIKTITMLGGHAMTAITSVTAQNSRGVDAVHGIPTQMVLQQIDAVISDFGIDAVKIGMIGSAETTMAVADKLADIADSVPIILDPVIVATSGAVLADDATIAAFGKLMDIATLTTPNLPELEALGGEAAVLEHGSVLLVKGGHMKVGQGAGDMLTDRLIGQQGEIAAWSDPRIDTPHMHGTGCTLSSAIAAYMGHSLPLEDATARARHFVRMALHSAPDIVPGNGPMGHGDVRLDAALPMPMLNQFTIGCSDYTASVAFYKKLGFTQIVDSPPRYARFETGGGVTFSLHATDKAPGDNVIYFESANIDQWCAELVQSSLTFDQMPRDESWGWREARLRDPHGNSVCLYHAGENRRFPPWRIKG